jgi:hypothetical protein
MTPHLHTVEKKERKTARERKRKIDREKTEADWG